ncbi:6-carboxyhexanoate--CoA ligase [Dissulfurispira thermophila]|nr:6-carboxyhexanoate--CoA ligase [Dissulfurispira thermophila]
MWNVRMRASKNRSQKSEVRSQNPKTYEIHISGAEGVYEDAEILKIVKEYTNRALNHPKGKPDNIVITLEQIKQIPQKVPMLPVITLKCNSPDKAKEMIFQILSDIGVPARTIKNSFKILTSPRTMRGAAIILKESGVRVEPDRERGVRVSRLGIEKNTEKILVRKLSKMKVSITTVKEALILASKVAAYTDVIAEICISDDPDYTTGYIASKRLGYIRIPNIKSHGQNYGGRVFIVRENTNINRLIKYLEKTPIIISGDIN